MSTHLKAASKEERTSPGLGTGARYFWVISKGPECFAFYNGKFYFHHEDKWQAYISSAKIALVE
eukprot:1057502-Amphidinium_carterae.1